MRSVPQNSRTKASGSGWPASEPAASRSPAAQPSVRSCSDTTAASDSAIPDASSSSRASSTEKRRSSARSSVKLPSRRSRCRPRPSAARVTNTTRRCRGSRVRKSSSDASASSECSSCRSSMTRTAGSLSDRRSESSRSTSTSLPTPTARPARAASAPPPVTPASASRTDRQNRCPSRSSRSTVDQPACSPSPASAIQERTRDVFPLPAGAETRVTAPAAASRWKSRCRRTTGSRPVRPWRSAPRIRGMTFAGPPLRGSASTVRGRALMRSVRR